MVSIRSSHSLANSRKSSSNLILTPLRQGSANSPGQKDNSSEQNNNNSNNLLVPKQGHSRGWSIWSNGSTGKIKEATGEIAADATSQQKMNHVAEPHGGTEDLNDDNTDTMQRSVSTSSENIMTSESNETAVRDKAEATRLRTWTLWGKRTDTVPNLNESSKNGQDNKATEVEVTAPTNSLSKEVKDMSIVNKLIPHNPDAVLIKDSSTTTKDVENDGTDNNINEVVNDPNVSEEPEQSVNIVVPEFEILPKKSVWSSMSSLIHGTNTNPQKYLYRVSPYSKLQELSDAGKRPIKVLLVGVHGFFPKKMFRTFIGEPTGTSTKFVNEAERVVLDYFKEKSTQIEVSKIALEKEGEIFERVDYFYEIMKKWVKAINNADLIYFVSHSQGCPVTIILLAKLIETGIINMENTKIYNTVDYGVSFTPKKKIIALLGMAGCNNGPFYGRDQSLLVRAYTTIAQDSMMELFEFQKFDSLQSKKLIQGLRFIISHNVKVTFVASINDQLIPVYSSFCSFADHPNIFRATFIDRDSNTPAFITRLAKISGTLINLGYDDHNMVKELSPSLVGPLTTGGHSSIYKEYQVYRLGIKFALETTDTPHEIPVKYTPYNLSEFGTNPYRLPWCMRGLVTEARKKMNPDQIALLYREYEAWQPQTKQLKDIKYRLNGLKYQL
ncbi:uncharacterized protein KNAG_0B03540 [Huiozyma naganishii CBS 8797]|uniref:YMC020W-like alpha/beta hydrolase domain-containing protein n=1 Tax=Huiozyma naganishii (strain ATCC MYA-139 / BCRC 22969 / CBS 8797 / KCTC 17520 / NBRC 10181 / NCYC 3082 / Yp74L-3) TaxID=1071383 RepID=J7S4T8_HUIN7|nr:hypothetical protein KNAG_0B03540 [Kazachstania naganishii CBS 8797]CCK68796.1 hypothetical protein KNAG_0B03540 [Kazachstania naganishii CBS 8797]